MNYEKGERRKEGEGEGKREREGEVSIIYRMDKRQIGMWCYRLLT